MRLAVTGLSPVTWRFLQNPDLGHVLLAALFGFALLSSLVLVALTVVAWFRRSEP
jgi:hypothetical protein